MKMSPREAGTGQAAIIKTLIGSQYGQRKQLQGSDPAQILEGSDSLSPAPPPSGHKESAGRIPSPQGCGHGVIPLKPILLPGP